MSEPTTDALLRELIDEVKALREAMTSQPIRAKRATSLKKENEELFQTVVEMWNGVAARCALSQVADITDRRQGLILARAEDLVKIFEAVDAPQGFWGLFGKVTGSQFLRGENKLGFKADFDWVLNKSNFTKIMEGKYDAPKETGKFEPAGRRR